MFYFGLPIVHLCPFSHSQPFPDSQFDDKTRKEQGQQRDQAEGAETAAWRLKLWAFWTHSLSLRLHLQSSLSMPVSSESQVLLSVCLPAQQEVHHLSGSRAAVVSADMYKRQHALQKWACDHYTVNKIFLRHQETKHISPCYTSSSRFKMTRF